MEDGKPAADARPAPEPPAAEALSPEQKEFARLVGRLLARRWARTGGGTDDAGGPARGTGRGRTEAPRTRPGRDR